MPAVDIVDLVVAYGQRRAVDGLSLAAEAGQAVALVGPNGAGKTSTVEACVGIRPFDSGRIALLGDSTPGSAFLRSRVGVMLQDGGLYPGAKPLELVTHVANLYAEADDPAVLLTALSIDPSSRTTMRRLSGGEQQRVKCALALVGKPDVVFLDEPTAGLDSSGRRAVHDLVEQVKARGCAVVLTTHLMDDVERVADRIVVMQAGKPIHESSVAELTGSSDTVTVRLPQRLGLEDLRLAMPPGSSVREVSPRVVELDARGDSRVVGLVATWCADQGLDSSALSVGRRSLEDAVQQLLSGAE